MAFHENQSMRYVLTLIVIYDVGTPSETFYILKSGSVALEIFFEIEHTNQIPIG